MGVADMTHPGAGASPQVMGMQPHLDPPVRHMLLIEDNRGDIRLTREALRASFLNTQLSVVEDGEQALAFLRNLPPYETAPRPEVILLDLNLPRRNGYEVLEDIKSHRDLKRIPIIVLTTSRNPMDMQMAYDLHANCYTVKPVDLDEFTSLIQSIESYWFGTATLLSGTKRKTW